MWVKDILISLVIMVAAGVAGYVYGRKIGTAETNAATQQAQKYRRERRLTNEWVILKQQGRSIENYFKAEGIRRIAIYDMQRLGETLYFDLTKTDIEVVCGIDKKKVYDILLPMYTPDDDIPAVDAIVVAAFTEFDKTESMLRRKTSCRIISLEDVINEC